MNPEVIGTIRTVMAGLLLGVAAGIALTLGRPTVSGSAAGAPPTAGLSVSLSPGSVAPDFVLSTPGGVHYRLAELRGKIVVVNFWATWCGPCRLEMPALQRGQDQIGREDMIVLAVNNDEPAEDVEDFGVELGVSFPLLLDPGGEVQRLYQVRAYPTTYFIDRTGRVAKVHLGLMTEEQINRYLVETEGNR